MRRTGIAVVVTAALGICAVGTTYAQQGGNDKKAVNQTPDKGVDDPAAPGQARKGSADRVVAQVPVTVHGNGVVVAELDEAFDEAFVVTINPDGTQTYTEVRGTAAAAARVHQGPAPASAPAPLEEK